MNENDGESYESQPNNENLSTLLLLQKMKSYILNISIEIDIELFELIQKWQYLDSVICSRYVYEKVY